jgi:hypothetical protein
MNLYITTIAFALAGPPAAAPETSAPEPTDTAAESKTDKLPAASTEAPAEAPTESAAEAEPAPSPDADAPPPTSEAAPPPETKAATAPAAEPAEPLQATSQPAPPAATPAPTAMELTGTAPTYRDRPITWRLDFTVGFGGTQVADSGYFAFDKDQSMLGFDVGARFDYRIGQRLFLGAGLRYSRFATDRNPYDGLLSTELTVHEPTVHGRASVMTVEGVDVFADVGGGPAIVLDRVASATTAAERRRSITGAFSAAGGVALYLPKKWLHRKGASRVTGGLETSFGYQFRGAIDVSTDRDLGDDPLDSRTADFGDVAMRGFVWRVGFFVRVM